MKIENVEVLTKDMFFFYNTFSMESLVVFSFANAPAFGLDRDKILE
jgi:hypothetical protein